MHSCVRRQIYFIPTFIVSNLQNLDLTSRNQLVARVTLDVGTGLLHSALTEPGVPDTHNTTPSF